MVAHSSAFEIDNQPKLSLLSIAHKELISFRRNGIRFASIA
jgi:hypothetical protein